MIHVVCQVSLHDGHRTHHEKMSTYSLQNVSIVIKIMTRIFECHHVHLYLCNVSLLLHSARYATQNSRSVLSYKWTQKQKNVNKSRFCVRDVATAYNQCLSKKNYVFDLNDNQEVFAVLAAEQMIKLSEKYQSTLWATKPLGWVLGLHLPYVHQ